MAVSGIGCLYKSKACAEAVCVKKKMEDRLKLGISNTDLARGMSKITGLNYLGDYSHDHIDVDHITGKPSISARAE